MVIAPVLAAPVLRPITAQLASVEPMPLIPIISVISGAMEVIIVQFGQMLPVMIIVIMGLRILIVVKLELIVAVLVLVI